jgi:hypothetical protein
MEIPKSCQLENYIALASNILAYLKEKGGAR